MYSTEYLILFIFFFISSIVALLLASFSYILVKQNPEPEKLSPYECGFEPYDSTRHVFDVQFCVVALIFVIFDVEMLFIIPWCLSMSKATLAGFWVFIDFFFELGVGFFYVWNSKALKW